MPVPLKEKSGACGVNVKDTFGPLFHEYEHAPSPRTDVFWRFATRPRRAGPGGYVISTVSVPCGTGTTGQSFH